MAGDAVATMDMAPATSEPKDNNDGSSTEPASIYMTGWKLWIVTAS